LELALELVLELALASALELVLVSALEWVQVPRNQNRLSLGPTPQAY
jgi:hypothetical protein